MVKMKLARGLAWNYASYAVEAIAGLAVVAFVVRRVGVADYGVLTLALAIAGLLAVLDLGLLGLLVPAYVGERTSGGADAVGELASAAISRLFLAGLTGFLVCVAIGWIYPGPFRLDAALVSTARACVIIVGAALVVSLPSLGIELAYVANGSFGAISRIQIVCVSIRAVATVALISIGYGVVALGAVHFGVAVLRLVLLWTGLARNTGGVRISFGSIESGKLRVLRANRGWATSDNIARQIASAADSITLGILATPSAVATYAVGKRIPGQLLAVTNRGIDVTLPFFSDQHHRDETPALRELFTSTLLTASALLIPVCILGIIFSPLVMNALGGAKYAASIPILRWLLGATMVQAFSVPAYAVLYARAQVKTAAKISIGEAIANVILTILLVPRYGGPGAAAATAITHTAGTFGWFLPAAMRSADLSLRDAITLVTTRKRIPGLAGGRSS